MKPSISRRTFNVEGCHRMAEARILSEDNLVELIEIESTSVNPSVP